MQSALLCSLASVVPLLLVQWTGRGDALCNNTLIEDIKRMYASEAHPEAILNHIEGEYEMTRLAFKSQIKELGEKCVEIKFTKKNGVEMLEFHGLNTPSYPFAVQGVKLVYEGNDLENTKKSKGDGKDDKDSTKDDKKENKKDKDKNKGNGQNADNKGQDKKDNEKGGGQEEKGFSISYLIIHHTQNVIALYTCSGIETEPAMAFVAVSTKSIEKPETKREIKEAITRLQAVGINSFTKIPFCKENQKENPKQEKPKGGKAKEGKGHHGRGKHHHTSGGHGTERHPKKPPAVKPNKEGHSVKMDKKTNNGEKVVVKGQGKKNTREDTLKDQPKKDAGKPTGKENK